uniref:Uncharacterized protein n=1 Tax=Avena sativa TaxID=4498 RepID=A0ACD5X5I8_AVESA
MHGTTPPRPLVALLPALEFSEKAIHKREKDIQMEAGPVAAATCGTPRAVAFSWEHEPGVSKLQQSPVVEAKKPSSRRTPAPDGAKKLEAHHRLRVPPPPGGPAMSPSASRRGLRPDEDPFLAAYLACTANGRKTSGRAGTGRGHKLLGWAGLRLGLGLGLSCKTSSSAVAEESLVIRLAKNPSSG